MALGAVRSCGVTTLALALAATWPSSRRVLLAELDPAGGTLAAASGWPPEPGLVSLAAAARRGSDPELVWEHCQELADGTAVLAGPGSADQARSALGMLTGLLGRLGELAADVLVDCGRLAGASLNPVLSTADQVVLAARPRLADLHALASFLETNPGLRQDPCLVLVGDGPYRDQEVAEALGVEVAARLPWDPDAAASLVSVRASARELRVAPLVRAARTLAEHLSVDQSRTDMLEVAETPPAAPSRIRVMRAWRADLAARSTNGLAPEEVSR